MTAASRGEEQGGAPEPRAAQGTPRPSGALRRQRVNGDGGIDWATARGVDDGHCRRCTAVPP